MLKNTSVPKLSPTERLKCFFVNVGLIVHSVYAKSAVAASGLAIQPGPNGDKAASVAHSIFQTIKPDNHEKA
jgi:hypothetical protein